MIVQSRLDSAYLAGNLLGDPSERDLFVYLPPGYESSQRRYCTAYLLHAFGGSAERLVSPPLDKPRWSPPIVDVLDPVFGRMATEPMIVVIPDGWTRYGCSQWVDSPVNGNFEQYVAKEVVSFVDQQYRTIPQPQSRGVLGFSSGGFGAWHLASRNPEVFGAMAMLSGDSYFDFTHKSVIYDYFDSIWPDAPGGPSEDNEPSQMAYALSACYSPNVDNPPHYVDLPAQFPSGEMIPEVWDRWLSVDPVVNYRERLDNLRRLEGIMLHVGANDDARLQWGHRILSHRLAEAGVRHEARENAGNHGGRSREGYQDALRWLSRVLKHD